MFLQWLASVLDILRIIIFLIQSVVIRVFAPIKLINQEVDQNYKSLSCLLFGCQEIFNNLLQVLQADLVQKLAQG